MKTISIATLSSSSLLSFYHYYYNNTYNDSQQDRALQLGNRLKSGLSSDMILKYQDNNLKVYEPRSGKFTSTNNLFNNINDGSSRQWMVSRVVKMEINANADDVANAWLNQGKDRYIWDNTCSKSQLLASNNDGSNLTYHKGYGGLISPARDYVYTISKTHGGIVGINNIMTIVLISLNDDTKLPTNFTTVRGYMNNILIIEKKNSEKTNCTLLYEAGPRGWLYPLSGLVSMLITWRLQNYMNNFKKIFEKDKDDFDLMSIDEIALKRFQKSQKEKNNIKMEINDTNDLKATIKMLEAKLADVSKTERAEKINLSELKLRIKNDLIAANNKLNNK